MRNSTWLFHDIQYVGNTYYVGTDGGVSKTTNSGQNYTDLSSGMQTGLMYGFGHSATTPYLTLSGWQDNGFVRSSGPTGAIWQRLGGGDGYLSFIDWSNDQNMYTSDTGGGILYSSNGGANFGSINGNITESGGNAKFFQDPVNSATIYVGYKNIWKSVNRGSSWTKISNFTWSKTTTFAVAKSTTSVIYAANGASMQKTTDGGANWSAIGGSLPTNASISDITIDNLDPNKAWITYSGYSASTKAFYTSNGGTTWTNITFSLPNIPINCIIKDNTTSDDIYIGTDIGMYVYNSSLSGWVAFSIGLPDMKVTQLAINYSIKKIRASSAGRGLWESGLYSSTVITNCTGSTASSDYEYINRVQIGNIDNASVGTTYSDFTSQSTSALRGSTMNISVTIGGGIYYPSDSILFWCDWNNDKVFDPTTELALTLGSIEGPNPYIGSIKIPANAYLGKIKMRIKLIDGANNPDYNSCGTTGFGEVEDYTLNCTDNVTAIDEVDTNSKPLINVYPTPIKDAFTLDISFPENGNYKLEIANTLGQIVYSEALEINNRNYKYSKKLNLGDLSKGVYIIHLSGDKTNTTKKIIME